MELIRPLYTGGGRPQSGAGDSQSRAAKAGEGNSHQQEQGRSSSTEEKRCGVSSGPAQSFRYGEIEAEDHGRAS